MILAAFKKDDIVGAGLVSADGKTIRSYALAAEEARRGVLPLLERIVEGAPLPPLGPIIPIGDVRLSAPIPKPRRNIFCVGKNYRAHVREFAGSGFDAGLTSSPDDIPSDPIIFTKISDSVIGPGETIRIPAAISTAIDYEAELAVVIGKGGKGIRAEEAMGHVWGYTIINDVTARDWQYRHKQWHMGKSFDTFCPMGPWIVSRDEFDGTDTGVRSYINGEPRQNGCTSDLIFSIPRLIETLSAGITLYPGDIIATGTPEGVGIGFKPPKYLKAGDIVRIEVDGIGVLENPVM